MDLAAYGTYSSLISVKMQDSRERIRDISQYSHRACATAPYFSLSALAVSPFLRFLRDHSSVLGERSEPLQNEPRNKEMANKPKNRVKVGRVVASIWENQSQNGARYSVTFQRLLRRHGPDSWEFSGSFGRGELLSLAKAADQADTWIAPQEAEVA